jgi:hypothetical protein
METGKWKLGIRNGILIDSAWTLIGVLGFPVSIFQFLVSIFQFPFSQVARAARDMLALKLMSARRHSHASS